MSFIPWTAIMEYAERNELNDEQEYDLLFFMRKMDDAFLKWYERTHGSQPKPKSVRKTARNPR